MTAQKATEQKVKALIIEDNEDNMVLISVLLQQDGYETLSVNTGQAGFEMALKERPDLILLDIQLPDISGFEVLGLIRSSILDDTIPVIAMTSYAMSGDRERLMAAGCTGYIEKPFDPVRVLQKIRDIMEKFK